MFNKRINILEKNDNTLCYLCLDTINYYYINKCKCHNYIHYDCIISNNINYCIICKKNNIVNNTDYNDILNNELLNIDFTIHILNFIKLKQLLDNIHFDIMNYNYTYLLSFIICSYIVVFMIIIPLLFINLLSNILIKRNIIIIVIFLFFLMFSFYYKIF